MQQPELALPQKRGRLMSEDAGAISEFMARQKILRALRNNSEISEPLCKKAKIFMRCESNDSRTMLTAGPTSLPTHDVHFDDTSHPAKLMSTDFTAEEFKTNTSTSTEAVDFCAMERERLIQGSLLTPTLFELRRQSLAVQFAQKVQASSTWGSTPAMGLSQSYTTLPNSTVSADAIKSSQCAELLHLKLLLASASNAGFVTMPFRRSALPCFSIPDTPPFQMQKQKHIEAVYKQQQFDFSQPHVTSSKTNFAPSLVPSTPFDTVNASSVSNVVSSTCSNFRSMAPLTNPFTAATTTNIYHRNLGQGTDSSSLNLQASSRDFPVILASHEDNFKLSSPQIFLRHQIEVFKATEDDVSTHTRGRNKPITLGQVGMRCRHCAHLPVSRRQKGSTYFPASLLGMYQAAQNMSTTHIQCGLCTEMPIATKQQFAELLILKPSCSGAGRPYWAKMAARLGLVDTDEGIRFYRDVPHS